MRFVTFNPASVSSIYTFINKPKSDIVEFLVYKNECHLGSIMPKMYKTEMKYDTELNALELTLYINREGYLCKENVLLNAAELKEYTFYYL
jgi:hypothetical protein